jgi:hypothetical protein
MGYELWTSPETGYRRAGTRLRDLHAVLGSGIVTRTIFEPLYLCLPDAPAIDTRLILERKGFDLVGVRSNLAQPILGYARCAELKEGCVEDYLQPIRPEDLISDSTELAQLFTVLGARPSVFVLTGSAVTGIVTRADLNKPPLRIYLFGLISLLEMHLLYWVRSAFPNELWKGHLKQPRLDAAGIIQFEREKKSEDISLIDCLQFCDKRVLVLKSDSVRATLGLGSKTAAGELLTKAEVLRNNLAHSQSDLVVGTSWEQQIKVVKRIEEVLLRSDQAIEQVAEKQQQASEEK